MPDLPAKPDSPDDESAPADEQGDEPSADEFAETDSDDHAIWQPQRGPLTRIIAWVILGMILLGTVVMMLRVVKG